MKMIKQLLKNCESFFIKKKKLRDGTNRKNLLIFPGIGELGKTAYIIHQKIVSSVHAKIRDISIPSQRPQYGYILGLSELQT